MLFFSCYGLKDQDFAHQVIDHAEKYVDGQVHTNGLENFWSLVKRGLKGNLYQRRTLSTYSGTWMNRSTAITTASWQMMESVS